MRHFVTRELLPDNGEKSGRFMNDSLHLTQGEM